ncbi:MAG: sugar ABC transporter substrate-binding protein [Pirellulaceae bacterium]|nr:sugar ABC transporter substrate-binding protein [Pirellulaceae bacterium]
MVTANRIASFHWIVVCLLPMIMVGNACIADDAITDSSSATPLSMAADPSANTTQSSIASTSASTSGSTTADVDPARVAKESGIPAVTVSTRIQNTNVGQACSCGHCQRCVNRTNPNSGMIGGLGMKHGIGPCGKKDCQCWQCPYDMPFRIHGPGAYAGPARSHRMPEYRLRTGDSLQLTYMVAPMRSEGAYRLVVGDELLIESVADEDLTRGTMEKGLRIQPDGTITLRLIGQVHAAGQTVEQLRMLLEESYKDFYPKPSIDVTPVNTGTAALQVREAISGSGGFDPQNVTQTITPSGEIRLPRLGSIQAQGLTLDELKEEINLRYDYAVGGLEVEPSLQSQAPHYFFVLGEANQPGRYNMDTPTTVLGAIAMAGGHQVGANLRQVVIFRRGDDWELISTLMDLRGAIMGRTAHPNDEIWIRDGDVIILPSTPIELFNNFVQQVFTEGIYGVIPLSASYNFGDSFNN